MCGIVGGVSPKPIRNYLINGLKTIEYRGYDSAGIAVFKNRETKVYKVRGRVDDLDKSLPEINSLVGIGHTRWATHGEPSVINAHPHTSHHGLFSIVHNGVIENFRLLKSSLIEKGYVFKSETDTEVIANLLEEEFSKAQDPLQAISLSIKQLKGSYALAIMFLHHPDKVYFAKNRSPLLIGHAKEGNYLASDYLPMLKIAKDFVTISDYQYGYISLDDIKLFNQDGTSVKIIYHATDIKAESLDLNGYDHYMLKEIEEADNCIRLLLDNYYDGQSFLFDKAMLKEIEEAENIIFLACGTSYHASLLGVKYFRKIGKKAEAYIASEWAFYPYIPSSKTIYIFVSQSGETADLIHCMSIVKNSGGSIITITNTQGSTLSRLANHTVLLYAGVEVAVASTKAYVAQVALLALLGGALKSDLTIIKDLEEVIAAQREIMKNHQSIIEIADFVASKKDVYFLGRGYDYDLALEYSLKLKETSYIHSEAFPGGELKHGPIALIEKDTPVIGLISDLKTAEPMRSNLHEVAARGARLITISSKSVSHRDDSFVVQNVPLYLSPLVKVVFGQYLSYYVALKRGVNIDKPRNLAKSVTVE
ncbi:MAG: glutamine--fructose-6-phosphate transaminase (isomerizing) [Erysipelotrichia bacterium]|nr:glutamine--fructose-6-phosphate transaminase (isomerizing) [Erysipelotrichia bacterium]